MRPLQKMVLNELAALERLAVGDPIYGWWKPFHVRYFRSENPMADRGNADRVGRQGTAHPRQGRSGQAPAERGRQ
jgi:hypothetical protein